MNLYENCTYDELEDGSLFFEDVLTPYGLVDYVRIGPGGIYVVLSDSDKPSALYEYFRNLLGVTRVRLYFNEKGEYIPASDSFTDAIPLEDLADVIDEYIYNLPQKYTSSALRRFKDILVKSDARTRGYYTDSKGVSYIFHNGEFRQMSKANSDSVFNLCLYGGTFGLHRFAIGKWFSGLFYLFTCGFFIVGWVLDLIQLFFGLQKDNRKRILRPLENRMSKLRFLPVGILVNVAVIGLWFHLL